LPAGAPPLVALGADAVRVRLLEDARAGRLSIARAAALPLFDADALGAAVCGDAPVDVPTLGFALGVEWMLEFLERARGVDSLT
jgi:hypothetical protein